MPFADHPMVTHKYQKRSCMSETYQPCQVFAAPSNSKSRTGLKTNKGHVTESQGKFAIRVNLLHTISSWMLRCVHFIKLIPRGGEPPIKLLRSRT